MASSLMRAVSLAFWAEAVAATLVVLDLPMAAAADLVLVAASRSTEELMMVAAVPR